MLYPDMNLQKRTQQNTTRYRTALYLRLSREDGDKTESDSVANQRTLLEAYAADHPELCIVDEFVDDGYSGSNFERPAFQRLFRELEQGTISPQGYNPNPPARTAFAKASLLLLRTIPCFASGGCS